MFREYTNEKEVLEYPDHIMVQTLFEKIPKLEDRTDLICLLEALVDILNKQHAFSKANPGQLLMLGLQIGYLYSVLNKNHKIEYVSEENIIDEAAAGNNGNPVL